jgi:hypothetical protein
MPAEWIHHPWNAPSSILEVAGVELGFNYPMPIVELHTARECLDDAISTMWQLDTAEKLAELDGEVVEDNLSHIKSFDIPKVVLKQLPLSATQCNQNVPTADGRNHELQPKEQKGLNKQTICVDVIRASKMEDTGSVANSPISRKRSGRGAFDVPSCSSSVEVHSQNHHPGGPYAGSSRYILQKAEMSSAGKVSLIITFGGKNCIRRPYEFSIFLAIVLGKQTLHDNTFVTLKNGSQTLGTRFNWFLNNHCHIHVTQTSTLLSLGALPRHGERCGCKTPQPRFECYFARI